MIKKIMQISIISILLVITFGCDMGGGGFDYGYSSSQETVSTPTISLESNFGSSGQKLVIKSNTYGVTIKYTTDGTIPSETNGIYYTSFSYLDEPTTVNAIAYRAGYKNSDVASRSFYKVSDPYPSISYDGNSVSFLASGADIYYSTSGSNPTSSNSKYYSQISASSILGDTLKVIATKSNSIKSNVVEVKKQEKPTLMELSGNVYIFHNTSGVKMRYTTNGLSPTQTRGTLITNGGKITASKGSTIKAIAYTLDSLNSDVATYYYY